MLKYPSKPITKASKNSGEPIYTNEGWVIWDNTFKVWLSSNPHGEYFNCADNGLYECDPKYFWTAEQVMDALNEEH